MSWNITKMIKTEQFFHIVTFYFWKSGVWDLEKPIVAIIARKHLIFKNKKLQYEKIAQFLSFW